jgi:membrane-bound ClpP family serine protease
MRAGLIIGGAFLMVFGAVLVLTILLSMFGFVFGFVGFIMFIVGLVTSSKQNITVSTPSNASVPEQKTIVLAICPQCKSRVPSESKFCPNCGASL